MTHDQLVTEIAAYIREVQSAQRHYPSPVEVLHHFARPGLTEDVLSPAAMAAYRRVERELTEGQAALEAVAGFLKAHSATSIDGYARERGVAPETAMAEVREWAAARVGEGH